MPTINSDDLLKWPIELLRIVEPPEAERLSSTSWDTLQRNHPDKVVHLSKRRVGMRVGHALMLGVKSPPDSVFDTCNNWAQPSVSAAGGKHPTCWTARSAPARRIGRPRTRVSE